MTAQLDKKQYDRLHRYLSKNYKSLPKQKRFMVRFFKKKVDVRESLDFRYKWTSGVNELVIKKGALGSRSREETTINLGKENQLDHFVKFFVMLGFKEVVAVYRETEKFKDADLEISLITAHPYAFVEVEAVDGKSRKKALERILSFYNMVGLKPLNKTNYQSYLRKLDQEVNLIFPLKEFPKPLLKSTRWKKILNSTILSE